MLQEPEGYECPGQKTSDSECAQRARCDSLSSCSRGSLDPFCGVGILPALFLQRHDMSCSSCGAGFIPASFGVAIRAKVVANGREGSAFRFSRHRLSPDVPTVRRANACLPLAGSDDLHAHNSPFAWPPWFGRVTRHSYCFSSLAARLPRLFTMRLEGPEPRNELRGDR